MSTAALALQKRVLSYWFQGRYFKVGQQIPNSLFQLWFSGSKETDEYISKNFKVDRDALFEKAEHEEELSKTAHGTLSMIILLDQFSRNLYRNSPKSFEADVKSVSLARHLIESNMERELTPLERLFVYLPYEHSESLKHQDYAIQKFKEVAKIGDEHCRPIAESFVSFSERHRVVIEKFRRFPHRNEVMGRPSTPEELHYLANGGENFSKSSSQ